METNQDLSIQDEEITATGENTVANKTDEGGTVVEESADKGFDETLNEGGLANSEPEKDDLEKEAYINSDLVSEEDIAEAREAASIESPAMPESNLSDPTQSENN